MTANMRVAGSPSSQGPATSRLGGREPQRRLAALVGVARACVLEALREPQTTATLATSLRIAPSTASGHLTALVRTGLLARRRKGREVYYMLNDRGRSLLALLDPPS